MTDGELQKHLLRQRQGLNMEGITAKAASNRYYTIFQLDSDGGCLMQKNTSVSLGPHCRNPV
jgi:hypothetical protein